MVLNAAALKFIFVKCSHNRSEFGLYSGKLCESLESIIVYIICLCYSGTVCYSGKVKEHKRGKLLGS